MLKTAQNHNRTTVAVNLKHGSEWRWKKLVSNGFISTWFCWCMEFSYEC